MFTFLNTIYINTSNIFLTDPLFTTTYLITMLLLTVPSVVSNSLIQERSIEENYETNSRDFWHADKGHDKSYQESELFTPVSMGHLWINVKNHQRNKCTGNNVLIFFR